MQAVVIAGRFAAVSSHGGACAGQCVTSLQNLLASKGFSPGAADGDFGPATETAVRNFQSSAGLGVRVEVPPCTWQ